MSHSSVSQCRDVKHEQNVSQCMSTDTFFLQMTVRVSDQRQPVEKSSSAQVTVNVLRNLNKPYFRNNPYSRQISELTTVSTSIITVTAVDDDLKVSSINKTEWYVHVIEGMLVLYVLVGVVRITCNKFQGADYM